jgi:6-phosphogluconolactonase
MSVKVEIVEDPARACADLLIDVAGRGGQIVAAGGSTPKQAYALAAQSPGAWTGAHLWFGDERCVPPDDERSNYLMVKAALLDPLAARGDAPEVHRIKGELGPVQAADAYEAELRAAGAPALDLVLLGVGPDGHTASLFPGKPALEERERLVVGVPEAGLEPFVPRVSFTFPALAGAERIVFLIAGAAKAEIVERVFGAAAAGGGQLLPSQMLIAMTDRITLLTDAAAAARL